jgi:hypothetical protein
MLLRRYHEDDDSGEGVTTAADVQPDATPDGAVSEDDYTLDELREQARELELPVSGNKSDLVERINAKLAE